MSWCFFFFNRHLHHTFLIPFALFYNEMVTVGKYRDRKSGTIANLQEYGTTDGGLILSMRLVVCCRRVVLFVCLFVFFRYIFFRQVLLRRLKSTIGHAETHSSRHWECKCLTQLQSLVAHHLKQ